MPIVNDSGKNRSDSFVTIFAIFAILLAGGISVGTMNSHEVIPDVVVDPIDRAEQAAFAGIQAAKGHIECHGVKHRGALPQQYFANGGKFEVFWDEPNMNDSTVRVAATGYYESLIDPENGSSHIYSSRLESVVKINLVSTHSSGPAILDHYYQRNIKNNPIVKAIPE
jgi:hypothetical protein